MRSLRSFPIALALLSLLIIVLVATDSSERLRSSNPSWVVALPSRSQDSSSYYYDYYVGQPLSRPRHSLLDTSRSRLCDHIEMIRRQQQRRPFPPISNKGSSGDYEIDPRYGVEKRLVPSGPNPLHN